MKYNFKKMNMEYANEIASWKYRGFMKSIYMDPYFDNYNPETKEMKGPGDCDGFAALVDNEVIGLYEYYIKGDIIEIGLALNPKYVGKGLSKDYILQGIAFMVKEYNYKNSFVQLAVEEDNKEAYHAYLKVGFKEIKKEDEEIIMYYYL